MKWVNLRMENTKEGIMRFTKDAMFATTEKGVMITTQSLSIK
jgi:hypothetical protein